MAEALGLVASIIAVLQLAGKVTTLGYEYISGVKRGSKDIGDLLNELGSLSKVLLTLKDYADTNLQSPALQQLNARDGPLRGCTVDLRKLQARLQPKAGIRRKIGSLTWPFREHEMMEYIARIERHKTLFILAITADQITLSRAIEAYVRETDIIVREIKTHVENTHVTIQGIEAYAQNTDLTVQDLRIDAADLKAWRQNQNAIRNKEKRDRVLDWLSSEVFSEGMQINISSKRQPHTGEWLFKAPEFQNLITGKINMNPSLLWGFGIAGTGKTFLCSNVIDHLLDEATANGYGVAYIYFHYKEREHQKPIHILASLVKQLATQIETLPVEIETLHDKLEGSRRKPKFEELYTVLVATFKSFSRVFLAFDALDECHQNNQRRELLPFFHRMEKSGANIFITSRQYPEDIRESFCDVPKIEISARKEDIEAHIRYKIEENGRAKRLIQQAQCQDKIISEVIDCANGMFLLARLHIEYLCQQTTVERILTALKNLKNNSSDRPLDLMYKKVMEDLYSQSEGSIELGLMTLGWLSKPSFTFTVEALLVAISIGQGQKALDEQDLPDKETILDICVGLVTINENTNTIQLAHYTVQEYLLQNSIITEDIEFKMATACTTYLSFDIFTDGPCTSDDSLQARLKSQPFLPIAVNYLNMGLPDIDQRSSTNILLKLLKNQGSICTYSQVLYESFDDYPKKSSALHIACALGHQPAAQQLLEQGADVSIRDGNGATALHEATFKGCRTILELLLSYGADVSARDGAGRTPLHTALWHGNEDIARTILLEGANPSSQSYSGDTPLHFAAYSGSDSMVKSLLRRGVDHSVQNTVGDTPLYSAALKKHESTIWILMEQGAKWTLPDDVKIKGGEEARKSRLGRRKWWFECCRCKDQKRVNVNASVRSQVNLCKWCRPKKQKT